jgi:hypothetical protein
MAVIVLPGLPAQWQDRVCVAWDQSASVHPANKQYQLNFITRGLNRYG